MITRARVKTSCIDGPAAARCFVELSVIMKWSNVQEESAPSAKRSVSHNTFLKWRGEMEKGIQTLSWLNCEVKTSVRRKWQRSLSARFA